MKEKEKEKESQIRKETNWESEKKKKERNKKRVSDKIKTLGDRKTENILLSEILYIEEIKDLKNTEIKKSKQNIDEKLKREIHQIHSPSYKQATRQANK